jgi:DNA-binding response OmpR family regulator
MRNILLIEDDEPIALMITMALAKYGFNVEIATDGKEGLKKFENNSFDLVITDIRMPRLNGNGVVQYIRSSKKKCIPVIGISGTHWLFGDGDFDAVLSKPFSIIKLVDTINSLTASALKHA